MVTIEQVLEEFLKEQRARSKPRTYSGYKDTIDFFKDYIGYASQYLDEDESELFDRLYDEEDREFYEIFGPDKIGASEIAEFLDDFMIRKVMCGKEFTKTVVRVMRKLVGWMGEKGYMDEREHERAMERLDDLKDKLPRSKEMAGLMSDYAYHAPLGDCSVTVDGDLKVTEVKPGKLWFEDYMVSGKRMGPVPVPEDISSRCEVGWVVSLKLGRTADGWRMLEIGNVYPR